MNLIYHEYVVWDAYPHKHTEVQSTQLHVLYDKKWFFTFVILLLTNCDVSFSLAYMVVFVTCQLINPAETFGDIVIDYP